MPAKSVTHNSQNYAGTLGSGLDRTFLCEGDSSEPTEPPGYRPEIAIQQNVHMQV